MLYDKNNITIDFPICKENKTDFEAINFYINELRNNNIKCDIKVFDEYDFYVLYLKDKNDYNKRDVINKASYDTHMKFENSLYKTIQCEYLYDWFENDNEIYSHLESKQFFDITLYFPKASNNLKNYINNFYLYSILKSLFSLFDKCLVIKNNTSELGIVDSAGYDNISTKENIKLSKKLNIDITKQNKTNLEDDYANAA